LPSCGSFPGPKRSSTMTSTMIKCHGCSTPIVSGCSRATIPLFISLAEPWRTDRGANRNQRSTRARPDQTCRAGCWSEACSVARRRRKHGPRCRGCCCCCVHPGTRRHSIV
jgi:hypothetical protein